METKTTLVSLETGKTTPEEPTSGPAKRYKPSRFTIHTPASDGTLLVYNGLTGHLVGIPAHAADHCRRCLSKEGLQAPLDNLGEYLRRKGYIIEETKDENAYFEVWHGIRHYRADLLHLILFTSEECNFRCVYCCQSFKHGIMLPEVRRGVRALIDRRIAQLRHLHMSWFGGEPLVGWEVIDELAPYVYAKTKEHGVQYAGDISTNGYLLTPERSRLLLDWDITDYQITIDGCPEDHNKHRPLKDGGESFETIFRNVVAMKQHDKQFRVRVRVNFDRSNIGRARTLFERLREHLGSDPRFRLGFVPVGKWGGPKDSELLICQNERQEFKKLRQEAIACGLNPESPITELDPDAGNICYAAQPHSFGIGATGTVMKCTVLMDSEDINVVGHLTEDGDLHLNSEKYAKWVTPMFRSDKACEHCFYVPVCQGGLCPAPRVVHGLRKCAPIKSDMKGTLEQLWQERGQAGLGKAVRLAAPAPAAETAASPVAVPAL